MYYKLVTAEDIYHHGIKGQKWGVRRYQNKDGTLTAAGRRRLYDREKGEVITDEGGYTTKRKMTKAEMDNIDSFNNARERFLRQEISRKEFEKVRRKLLDKNTIFDNTGIDLEAESSGRTELRLRSIVVIGKQESDRAQKAAMDKIIKNIGRERRVKAGKILAGTMLGSAFGGLTYSYLKSLGLV